MNVSFSLLQERGLQEDNLVLSFNLLLLSAKVMLVGRISCVETSHGCSSQQVIHALGVEDYMSALEVLVSTSTP